MTRIVHEIDVRPLPPLQRTPAALDAFDSLRGGQTMVLVNNHQPKAFLFKLQEERPQWFDWSVLQAGPSVYRVAVGRRAAKGPFGVREYLTWDHHRLDELLVETRRLLAAASAVPAALRFDEYCCGFTRHVDMEEQIVLPAFERTTGAFGNAMATIYSEHEAAYARCDAIFQALGDEDCPTALTFVDGLRDLLLAHSSKEEQVLLPLCDHLADGARGRYDLVRWMQAL
jgi:uncharacterized protein (DUF2249 family)